jgi:hypothetical protein
MPSLRAGLNAAWRERDSAGSCLVRHLMGVFLSRAPGSKWLIMPDGEVPGRVPFRYAGWQRRIAWRRNQA